MTVALALLQAGQIQDNSLYIVLGVVTLFTIVVLGLKFWRNMFEVITAPTASIGYHGQNDNFFFSLVIVILGGLIGTFILVHSQGEMVQGFHVWSMTYADTIAHGNPSEVYRDVAANWGTNQLDSVFGNYFIGNLAYFSVCMVAMWILVGFLAFLGAKMFGGHTTLSTILGALAYPYFFLSIATAASIVSSVGNLQATAGLVSGSGDLSGTNMLWMTVGLVLGLYGTVLWFIALAQGGQLTVGGIIGVLVVLLIVVGGLEALAFYQGIIPWHEQLVSSIQTIDPSKPGYQIPE